MEQPTSTPSAGRAPSVSTSHHDGQHGQSEPGAKTEPDIKLDPSTIEPPSISASQLPPSSTFPSQPPSPPPPSQPQPHPHNDHHPVPPSNALAGDAVVKSESANKDVADVPVTSALTSSHPSPAPPPQQPPAVSPPPPSSQTKAAAASSASAAAPKSSDDTEMAMSADDAVMTDPVVYGTRSRNRNAGSRPNYAEDQDMDFEYTAPTKPEAKRNSSVSDAKRISNSHESKFSSVNDSPVPDSSVAKDTAPSTTNSNPPAPNTKKRKAASSAATPANNATPSQTGSAATSTASSLRRAAHTSTPPPRRPETNMVFFDKCKNRLNKRGQLVADDGTVFGVDDHIYLVCEPPGEPYYLGRIMEFIRTVSDDPTSPIVSIRMNWYYRPRDVGRHNNDTRLVYGTMHSDICPLTSLRGKCQIYHRAEIDDLDQYRKNPDHFWFNQIIDRFIRRFYEVVPTNQVINVPEKVKAALDERWKYVVVEASRVKELTSAVKLCKRCSQYCASNDSVDCAMCANSYHMNCVRPPLPKKPSRGFAWACGPCSRAQEKKLEARHTPQVGGVGEEEEILEEEEEEPNVCDSTRAPTPDGHALDEHPATEAELALAKMWPMRYLGIHCQVEDAMQYDDPAIYPRATSRLGPRHQATVNTWPGQPFQLVKPTEIKKKYVKAGGHKKDTKLSKDTLAAMEADRAEKANRPEWVVDEPPGYVARGEDYDNDDPRNTAQLEFRMPPEDEEHTPAANETFIENFMQRARGMAKSLRVSEYGVNLMDKALSLLIEHKYDAEKALQVLAKVDRGVDLKEPILTHEDLRGFEDGVHKFGSEHRLIKQNMKGSSLPISAVIRFYYLWKKTPRGQEIWGSFGGRKSAQKKQANNPNAADSQNDIGDDADDSAYDTGKAVARKKEFQCKFCSRRHSSQWRRAPAVATNQPASPEKTNGKDKTSKPTMALCLRCAGLWRRYAIQWEEQDEVARKVAQGGGKAWKRRIDEELLRELQIESNMGSREVSEAEGMTPEATEPAKKKAKTTEAAKPKPAPVKVPTPPPPPIVPDPPKFRALPCFVCKASEETQQQLPITCIHCKMTVHRHCYGLADQNIGNKWVCDQCTNDRAPLVSTDYVCTLCPIEFTPWDLWEPSKVSHKKKTDRDREKERLDKDLLDKAKLEYTKRQADLNRPLQPREPLKKTDGNNWVHVLCAVWTPEIKFSNAKRFERAEGFSMISTAKYETMCKLCKSARHGACVSCLHCHANFHVACAFEAGYTFGFDVTPVKSSRKDQVTTVSVGAETGFMAPAIWCRDHTIKTIVHAMDDVVDDQGTTALELFVNNYKQADQTLTGTARKANLLSQTVRVQAQTANVATAGVNRRVSTFSIGTARKARNSIIGGVAPDDTDNPSPITPREMNFSEQSDKKCFKCGIETSPKWWPVGNAASPRQSTINGILEKPLGINGLSQDSAAPKPAVDGALLECHKCHHKALKPPKRIPLSPKPLNINLDWPPCLSEPREPQARGPFWPDQGHLARPGEGHPPGYNHMNDWQYGQPPPFAQPHMGGHLPGRPPLPPMPPGPQANGSYPFGHADGPSHLNHNIHQPNGNFFDRPPPPRSGPPAPALPPAFGPSSSHPPPPPPPHHMSPHHGPQHPSPRHGPHQGSPLPGPPPFVSRSSSSPFHHPASLAKPNAAPIAPPRSSPAPASVGPLGMADGAHRRDQPSTPKPLEGRPGASNSPHIGNLLS